MSSDRVSSFDYLMPFWTGKIPPFLSVSTTTFQRCTHPGHCLGHLAYHITCRLIQGVAGPSLSWVGRQDELQVPLLCSVVLFISTASCVAPSLALCRHVIASLVWSWSVLQGRRNTPSITSLCANDANSFTHALFWTFLYFNEFKHLACCSVGGRTHLLAIPQLQF